MKKIKIGFSKPKGKWFPIFSWLIRLYEKTPYSHVYVRWGTRVGFGICYHAASHFVHFLSDLIFLKKVYVIEEFEFEIDDQHFDQVLMFCLENCGREYGLLEVLGIPIMDLLKLEKNPFGEGEGKQYCAQLVARVLTVMGDETGFIADRVRLKEVYDFVKKLSSEGRSGEQTIG